MQPDEMKPDVANEGLRAFPDGVMPDAANAAVFSADAWEQEFASGVALLAAEILTHIRGDICYKYSGNKVELLCRHGFYYIFTLYDDESQETVYNDRRKGKPLCSSLFMIKQTTYGIQGRVMQFQQHPFDVQSNYAATAALRGNYDVQHLRRVLPENYWLPSNAELSHIGDRPVWGDMNWYEWDGANYVERRSAGLGELSLDPLRWDDTMTPEDWRSLLIGLALLKIGVASSHVDPLPLLEDTELMAVCDRHATNFYINAYSTKQCSTMDGVLWELQKGLESLKAQRVVKQEQLNKQQLDSSEGLSQHESAV